MSWTTSCVRKLQLHTSAVPRITQVHRRGSKEQETSLLCLLAGRPSWVLPLICTASPCPRALAHWESCMRAAAAWRRAPSTAGGAHESPRRLVQLLVVVTTATSPQLLAHSEPAALPAVPSSDGPDELEDVATQSSPPLWSQGEYVTIIYLPPLVDWTGLSTHRLLAAPSRVR